MNENPLYSEQGFWKQEKKLNKKTSEVKNPEKKTKTKKKAAAETAVSNLVNESLTANTEKTIQYLKNFSESIKQQKNLEKVLQNLRSKKFAKVFFMENEKVSEEVGKVIADYVKYPEISYYLLYLCFTKFCRDTKSEDMEPYYQSLIKVVKVIIKIVEDEKNVKSSTRDNLSRFFRDLTLQIVRYDKYKLKYLEKISLIDGILIALNKMDISNINSQKPEVFGKIIVQLEGYLKYIKFLADFYSKGNQQIPFEMEIIAYMTYEAKSENQFFQLDLLPDTSDSGDSNWQDIYACTYRTVPQVEPKTYKKYYQFRIKADGYFQMLNRFKNSLNKLEYNQISEKLITLLYTAYKVEDYDAGFMLVEIALNIYKDAKGNLVPLASIAEAQEILNNLVKKKYQIERTHPWIEKVPEYIEFIKKRLDDHVSKVRVSFPRDEDAWLLPKVLRNLYAIGSNAAGLMLAKLSVEYFRKTNMESRRYNVDFKEASKILNLFGESFKPKECDEVQKAIKDIEDEVLSETDDETTGIDAKDTDAYAEDEEETKHEMGETAEKIAKLFP